MEHSIRHNEMYEPVRTSTQKVLDGENRPVPTKRTSTLKKSDRSLEGSIVSNPIWNKSTEKSDIEELVVEAPVQTVQATNHQQPPKARKESANKPPLPKNPPSTRKTTKKIVQKPKSVAYQARIRPEYRCEPTVDPSFYKADQYVPQFYHERFWQNPERLKPLNITSESGGGAPSARPKEEMVSGKYN